MAGRRRQPAANLSTAWCAFSAVSWAACWAASLACLAASTTGKGCPIANAVLHPQPKGNMSRRATKTRKSAKARRGSAKGGATSGKLSRWRTPLLIAVLVRIALGLVAVTLAPILWKEHFLVVVLLRPTKEVLLTAGFLIRTGRLTLVPAVLASLPLLLGGVWLLYALGRAWDDEALGGKSEPKTAIAKLARRVLPP